MLRKGKKEMSPDMRVDVINDELRRRILKGEFGTAGRLPSLRMLAEQFGTTHETMNKVVQRLQAEGLLLSLGRAGIFVNSTQKHIPGITRNLAEFFQQQGLTLEETNIDEPSIVKAPAEVAEALNLEEGTEVVRRYRSQGLPQGYSIVPYRLAESFYPKELVDEEMLERMRQDVHFDVLAAIKVAHSIEINRVHEDVYGRLPTLEEQEKLKIVRNTPVFDIRRTNYAVDEDGKDEHSQVIMYSRIIFVASHFVLSYDYTPYWLSK
jgi:DNA-binding GntR family transcriptional regulator